VGPLRRDLTENSGRTAVSVPCAIGVCGSTAALRRHCAPTVRNRYRDERTLMQLARLRVDAYREARIALPPREARAAAAPGWARTRAVTACRRPGTANDLD